MYPQSMYLAKNKKNINFFHLKVIIFTAFKNHCMLNRHVCVILCYAMFLHVFQKEETHIKTSYTQNPKSMLQYSYDSVMFVVKKPS